MPYFVATCFLTAFIIAWIVTKLMRAISPKIGLIDQPAARKSHTIPTPLGGGIAIYLGVVLPLAGAQVIAWWLTQNPQFAAYLPSEIVPLLSGVGTKTGQLWAILAGGTVLSSMGLIDDLKNLPWQPRLALQFCVAVGLVASGVHAAVFIPYPWIGWCISTIWILALINSFNFLDNMDGLSSGIALIASVLFAIVMLTSTSEPRWLVGGVLIVLSGALAGFLCHNWPPAKIFMGDSGSYFIGLMLASMTILGTFYDESSSGRHIILAPLCILAVPLYDTCSVIVIRLSEGRSPFRPDKSHFSHRLVELGLKPQNAVMTIHLATLTTGLGGLLLYRLSDWSDAGLVISLILCVLGIIAILENVGRRREP